MIWLGWVTEAFFPRWVRQPWRVNRGCCMFWAWLVTRLRPDAELWTALDEHAFIRLGDRFYDSERPLGVPNPAMLPGNADAVKYVQHSDHDFVSYWYARRIRGERREPDFSAFLGELRREVLAHGVNDIDSRVSLAWIRPQRIPIVGVARAR